MLNILAAILLFGLIILVHEFGHFLFAKLNGIAVLEFSIGMGPRLASFVKGETRYSIKALPFGGSCMMMGEDGEDPDPRSFNNKPVWARILVIAAGPVFNFILAFLFALVIVAQTGHDAPILSGVQEDSPAQEAGLMPGDRITQVNKRKVTGYRDVSMYLYSHPGETVTIRFDRPFQGQWQKGTAFEKRSVVITPEYNEEYQSYMLGVEFAGYQKVKNPISLLRYSAYEVKNCIVSTFDGIRMMVKRQIAVDDAVAGPVRLVTMVGETVEQGREGGIMTVVYVLSTWVLLISSSLGIMNLLPIPALDGGRLLFLFLELLRGKPIDPEKEGMIHATGLMVLMAVMVLVLFQDIRSLMIPK